ncbi:hypothetical protein BC940DRAFT_314253 [Gongronella butleri]|nr:hypothetical protein BC940DRAFT_314253 [Gongronella butleri]
MDSLPNELISHILDRVRHKDLRKLRMTSSRLRDLVSPIMFARLDITVCRHKWRTEIDKNKALFQALHSSTHIARIGLFVQSLTLMNCISSAEEVIALLKGCPNVKKLKLALLDYTDTELRAIFGVCRNIQHLELVLHGLDQFKLTDIILPCLGSLQSLRLLRSWYFFCLSALDGSFKCHLHQLVALQNLNPYLNALEFEMDDDSPFILPEFMEAEHRSGHDPDCDACTNPWASIKSLTIQLSANEACTSTLQAMVAFLCLKFPNLDNLAITCKLWKFGRKLDDPAPNLLLWRTLLDPSVAYLPSLKSLKIEHEYPDYILGALHGFTSVPGASTSTLSSLKVETVPGFRIKHTKGLLAAFPALYTLVIKDRWGRRDSVHEDLSLNALPLPLLGHQLCHLRLYGLDSTFLLEISQLCPQLTHITLDVDHEDLFGGHTAAYPEQSMPDAVDQYAIVQKFKRNPNWRTNKMIWVPLPYSTRLKSLKLAICKSKWHVVFFVQTPVLAAGHNSSASAANPEGLLDLDCFYYKHGAMQVLPDAQSAVDRQLTRPAHPQDHDLLKNRQPIIILAPCKSNIVSMTDYIDFLL